MEKPPVWQMITEAVDNLNGKFFYSDIKDYINKKWRNVNQDTITAQIIVLTVNHKSRIHYPENHKPRLTDSNSQYDLLYYTNRGQVEKYSSTEHGIWEIHQDETSKFRIRQINEGTKRRIYTPTDIIWFKNVTNSENGAYLNLTESTFFLNFPNIHKPNILSPGIDELILIYQKINNIPSFTHIVTPIDTDIVDENIRPDYRYARRVKVIAKTENDNFIPVSATLWDRLNFAGITQGNACKIENISNIGNIDELQFDIWQRFARFIIPAEQQSAITVSSILTEIENLNPDLSVTEGELRLVTHIVKERDPKIVREKKQQAIRNNTLKCEVCTFSFASTFNANYIECHHIIPIGQTGLRNTALEDLALVCANCHRMLHTRFDGVYLTIEGLKERIHSLPIA